MQNHIKYGFTEMILLFYISCRLTEIFTDLHHFCTRLGHEMGMILFS